MRSTNKENAFWSKGGETGLGTGNGIGMKVFANTFAGWREINEEILW